MLWAFLNPLNFRKPFKQPKKVRNNNIFVLQKQHTACYPGDSAVSCIYLSNATWTWCFFSKEEIMCNNYLQVWLY